MPAMPAPRISTDFPAPAFAGQSPGRGDGTAGGGAGAAPEDALEEPQPAATVPSPIAAIVLSIAAPPAARPMPARKSRRAILRRQGFMFALL
jgi:hypothetical protein